jgi:hypothetical protein
MAMTRQQPALWQVPARRFDSGGRGAHYLRLGIARRLGRGRLRAHHSPVRTIRAPWRSVICAAGQRATAAQ